MLGNEGGERYNRELEWNFCAIFPRKNFIIFSSAFFLQSVEYVIMYVVHFIHQQILKLFYDFTL